MTKLWPIKLYNHRNFLPNSYQAIIKSCERLRMVNFAFVHSKMNYSLQSNHRAMSTKNFGGRFIIYLTRSTPAMSMSRALVDTTALCWDLTEPSPKTIVFAITFFLIFHFRSISFSWVYITPARFTSIGREDILEVRLSPISRFWAARFSWQAETKIMFLRKWGVLWELKRH